MGTILSFLLAVSLLFQGTSDQASISAGSAAQSGTAAESPAGSTAAESSHESQQERKTYTAAPELTIDITKSYTATVTTNKGSFTMELYADSAPNTVNNFIFLAREGYYDQVIFHRIIESFMIQTGDPTGTGSGGPGYLFNDELGGPHTYEPGIVAMANAGPNTNGSQFFICTGEDSLFLNHYPNYTIFGKITEGMDVVQAIAATPVGTNPLTHEMSAPQEEISIQSVTVQEQE
ncbi:peptidylprolyl isomerase [Paenibacillus sp. y28]|uniref:peptidylprolyl isomerase n=1 Tax=Paenibacillus sp. y28 TaxID=3129110 RepID=UPI003019FD80